LSSSSLSQVLALMQDTSEKMPKEMCAECNERFAIKVGCGAVMGRLTRAAAH